MESSEPTIASKSDGASEAVYKYQPIQSKSEIRILELLPPDPHDPSALHGNLITARLADKPSYEAISYVWGAPIFSETLHLPTGTLGITPSLAAALRRFRYHDQTRRLWADAICINQKDGLEKGHQVQLMGDLYRNTKHMLAWLGEGNEETDATMAFLKSLGSNSWRYGVLAERPHEFVFKPGGRGTGMSAVLHNLLSQSYSNSTRLKKFFEQEWFHRLWIVQEVALASEFTLYNGTRALDHETFSAAIACLSIMLTSLDASPFEDIFKEVIQLLVVRWPQQFEIEKGTLFDLINITHTKRCSNALDCVYALLGLSTSDNINVKVDYEASLKDVFINIAYGYLSGGCLWILQNSGMVAHDLEISGHRHALSLPSWVCKVGTANDCLIISEWENRKSGREVSTILKPEIMPLVGIRGTRIDNAKSVIQTPDGLFQLWAADESAGYSEISGHFVKLRKLWSEHRNGTSCYTEENEELAFARALMADGMLEGIHMNFYSAGPSVLLRIWRNFQKTAYGMDNATSGIHELSTEEQKEVKDYIYALLKIFDRRTFIITQSGYIGVGPGGMKEDDTVVSVDGYCGMPLVLRRVRGDATPGSETLFEKSPVNTADVEVQEKWELVGACYLHGFMHGEEEQPEFEDRRHMFFIQ